MATLTDTIRAISSDLKERTLFTSQATQANNSENNDLQLTIPTSLFSTAYLWHLKASSEGAATIVRPSEFMTGILFRRRGGQDAFARNSQHPIGDNPAGSGEQNLGPWVLEWHQPFPVDCRAGDILFLTLPSPDDNVTPTGDYRVEITWLIHEY